MATIIKRQKIEIDATNQAPGRLATKIAMILMGKHKPGYIPHIDSGDSVVVFNVDKMKFTGKKMDQKVYRHHTMHPGGLKEVGAKKMMKENPRFVLRHAVARMIPKNRTRKSRLLRISFK